MRAAPRSVEGVRRRRSELTTNKDRNRTLGNNCGRHATEEKPFERTMAAGTDDDQITSILLCPLNDSIHRVPILDV